MYIPTTNDSFGSLDNDSGCDCCHDNENGGFEPLDSDGTHITPGSELSSATMGAVLAAIRQRASVSGGNKLEEKVRAGDVAIINAGGRTTGVAVLKDQSERYRTAVQERSRIRIPDEARELSYWAGSPEGIAAAIKTIADDYEGDLYATAQSTDTVGVNALRSCGFTQMGKAYPSKVRAGVTVAFYARSAQ